MQPLRLGGEEGGGGGGGGRGGEEDLVVGAAGELDSGLGRAALGIGIGDERDGKHWWLCSIMNWDGDRGGWEALVVVQH